VLSIGIFFGWLLSFPLQGPLFSILVTGSNVRPVLLTAGLLAGLVIGLAGGGIIGFFFRRKLVWCSLGAVPCVVISLFMPALSEDTWWVFFMIIGIASGAAIISWGNTFRSSVLPEQRGRTFAIAALISNLILYFVTVFLKNQSQPALLLLIVSFLPLSMTLLVACHLKTSKNVSPVSTGLVGHSLTGSHGFWQLFLFIFLIQAVGGLMYVVMGNVADPPPGPLTYFTLVPYILWLFAAGIIADTMGRKINAAVGAIAVGIGFMTFGLFKGPLQFVLIQTFLIGGYAFLDVFIWVTAADVLHDRRAPLFFGSILATNILAILSGVLLCDKIGAISQGSELIVVSLAGIFCFVSLIFVIKLRETFNQSYIGSRPAQASELETDKLKMRGLTPRESEVAELLLAGVTTKEMLERLIIAPDTLKTHLRNIYRKAGVHNRLEFVMLAIKNFSRPEQNLDQS